MNKRLLPTQQPEVLIQYGHLEEDLQQLASATNRQMERQQEFGLVMMMAMLSPIVIIESAFHFLSAVAPHFLFVFANLFAVTRTGISYTEQAHGLLYALMGPIFVLLLVIYGLMRLHALGPWGPFAPTHIGLLPEGIRRHWKSIFIGWTFGLRPWKDVTAIQIREYGRKGQRQRITLRYAYRLPISIEVTAIRRSHEKETLANALRFYLPDHLKGELDGLLQKTLPKQPRYTEIWTQALLNRPQRLLLTALKPNTELHDGLYTITEQIGAGGQGTAYLAKSAGLIPRVVLKEYVLPDNNNAHDRRRALKKLETEVQILSRLNHEQIVKLHDVFIEDHRAYLVMDYIDGPTLKSVVAHQGQMPLRQALELSMQMCAMLEYLHSLSPPLVHQDFTPDNLLLTSNGVLKLVDFNVAKESSMTKTSLVVGKQAYMPPEQFRGRADVQSDIYALGATMHFLLTGAEPEPITASHPRSLRSDVSEALDALVARATALEVESRFKVVGEVRAALVAVQEQDATLLLAEGA